MACTRNKMFMKKEFQIKNLTLSNLGHMLHHNSVFSANGEWIVFDGRNDDTKIGETSTIGIVNTKTGEERIIYNTIHQSKFGPGVGAASFHPIEDKVIFIHGLYDADESRPYDMMRRFGMVVDISAPNIGIHYDARDLIAPYTVGSLRGGTHSHCWSSNGKMLSFTYNDELVEQDLRMVGVMIPSEKDILVPTLAGNNNGKMFSAILTDVVRNPKWGSDEISKAFDESWLPTKVPTIVFQGHTRNKNGELITEIYKVEVNSDLILSDSAAVGKQGQLPQVPKGIQMKRLTHTEKGISDFRHWLRASADGEFIYALAKDNKGRNQILQCDVETGKCTYLSDFTFDITSPINLSYAGDKISFIANNNVYLFDIESRYLNKLTDFALADLAIVGAPVFSRQDDRIAFNQFCDIDGQQNVQIKLIEL